MTNFDRRSFLSRGALLAGATVMGPAAFTAITAGAAGASEGIGRGRGRRIAGDYGPLAPVPAVNEPGSAYLALPDGFSYVVFGKIGSPMTDTNPTPVNLDGMAAFAGPDGTVRLIRNHEDRSAPGAGSVLGPVSAKYDPLGGGGTTSLDFNLASRTLVRDFISLNGTIVNCAGGIVTIEGKTGWMTSEETTAGPPTWAQKHGYNFFVPVDATGPVKAEPYRAMGRFAHEAVIREDRTGIFYQTEDAGSGRGSGFYRYLPTTPDARAGRLQMLAIKNQPQADLREGQRQFKPLPVEWVNIPNPDPADPIVQADKPNPTSVFAQGFAAGGAKFNRLEGIWDGGSSVFFASTSGGDAKNGDVNSDGFREATGRSGVPAQGQLRRSAHPRVRVPRPGRARLTRQPAGHPPWRHPALRGRRQQQRRRHPPARSRHHRRQPAHRPHDRRRRLRVRRQPVQRQRVRRRLLQPRRQHALRQHLRGQDPRQRDDLRHHRTMG